MRREKFNLIDLEPSTRGGLGTTAATVFILLSIFALGIVINLLRVS